MLDTNQIALPTDVPLLPGELPSFTGLEATGCQFQKDDSVVCFFPQDFQFLLVVAFCCMGCQCLMSCDLILLSCDPTVFPPKTPRTKGDLSGSLPGRFGRNRFHHQFQTVLPFHTQSGCAGEWVCLFANVSYGNLSFLPVCDLPGGGF